MHPQPEAACISAKQGAEGTLWMGRAFAPCCDGPKGCNGELTPAPTITRLDTSQGQLFISPVRRLPRRTGTCTGTRAGSWEARQLLFDKLIFTKVPYQP